MSIFKNVKYFFNYSFLSFLLIQVIFNNTLINGVFEWFLHSIWLIPSFYVLRLVRVGIIQNSIAIATSEPIEQQRLALHHKIKKIIEAAAELDVNVLCLQEAWRK